MKKNITIICGHYGSGKTNLALNLAVEAARGGESVTLVDLDLVNPYFCSSEHKALFEENGITLISSGFAGTNLDTPSLPASIGGALSGDRRVFVDLGGDDAGATAMGVYSSEIQEAGYEMLYVINCYRVLSQKAEEAAGLLMEIEAACRLRATALINNSHLGVETRPETLVKSIPFAREVCSLTDLPLLYSTAPEFSPAPGFKTIRRYVKFPWENDFPA